MVKRKQFRVTIPADRVADFDAAKKAIEKVTGIGISDSLYALGIIKRALDAADE